MQAFLESFKSVDEVYQECKKRGIKGVPDDTCNCIIAELLKSEYPERFENGNLILVMPYDDATNEAEVVISKVGGGFSAEYQLPRTMNAFALAFDEGQYPDLVK